VLDRLFKLLALTPSSCGGSTYDAEGHRRSGGHVEGAGGSSAGVALVAGHLVGAEVLDGGVALEVGGGADILPVAAAGAATSADPGNGVYMESCQYVSRFFITVSAIG
jgi:hypothetical protein